MEAQKQSYSDLAGDYDRKRFSGGGGEFLARCDASIVTDLIRRAGVKSVLDCPVGTGRALNYLSDEPIDVVGVDYTWEMLRIAAAQESKVVRGLVRGDASKLPFPDESFDCVLSLRFFHLFPVEARKPFVDEFHRVLAPGGYLLCSFTNGWHGFGVNWIKKGLGKLGVHFQGFGELSKLKKDWKVIALRGNYLPGQRLSARLGPTAERIGRWFTFRWPLNRFCHERFYLLQKR